MPVNLSPLGGAASQFFDNNGVILTGGKIYTYAAGTTTPQATYTSSSGATPHANPIILDSAGRVPGGEIWLTDNLGYKFVIETSTGILLGTYDNVSGIIGSNINATSIEYYPPFTGGLTSGYTVADKLSEIVSVKDFGAVGDGVADDTAAITAAFTYANSLKRTGLVATIQHPGCTVVFPGGTYNVPSISTSFLVQCNVQSDGAGILVPAAYAGTVLTVGLTNSGDLLSTADITLPDVYKPTLSTIVAGSTGVRIANLNASVVRFGRIDYFARAMHFGGIGQGSVYCDFFLGQTSYADVIIYITPGSGGWCNANNFYGGNFRLGGARVTGQYHILMDGSAPATAIVGNNFIGTSLEGNGAIYVVYAKNAYGNTFNGLYNETQPALKSVTVSGDTLTSVGHGLPVGAMLTFIAAVVPTGMFELTPYYVVDVPTADTFKVSRNKGGTAVTFSSSGTSVQYYWQASCYFDGSAGAVTYNNVFNDIFAPPSILLDFVNVGQALNNGEQNVNLRTVRAFNPSDAPSFRASNTSSSAATRTSFATYPITVDPVTQPTLWTTGISDQGIMFQTPGTATESGRITSENGVLFYEALNNGTLAQVPSGFRSVGFTTLGTTSVPANGRAIATLTVTGASVGDYVVPMINSALPDGIAIAWARASAADSVQIAFHNWTGAPIDIAGAQLKALVYRSVY